MGRLKGFDLFSIAVVSAAGIWMGTKFFEPIIIDQLKKDGNLRSDVAIPEYDSNGDPAGAKPMSALRDELVAIQQREKAEAAYQPPSSLSQSSSAPSNE